MTLTATDGGSGTAMTEYRLDGGAFQPYAGPLTVAALGGHLLEFRSRDRAGNLENLEELAFAVGSPQSSAPPAFVALTPLAKRLAIGSLAHGVRVRATCVSVGRGTLALTVSRATARKLGVGRTLAQRSVSCANDLHVSAMLKPSQGVARKLKRAHGTFSATLSLRMGKAHDSQKLTLRGRRGG